jgi:hypothetical protein
MEDPQILDSRIQNCCLGYLVPSQQFCILVWCMIKIILDQNETHLTTGNVNIVIWKSWEAIMWFERLNVQMVSHMHINTCPVALQHFIYALSTNVHIYVALRWTFFHFAWLFSLFRGCGLLFGLSFIPNFIPCLKIWWHWKNFTGQDT